MFTKKALVVGINNYENNKLSCCVNDAESIASMLEMPEYKFSVKKLIDQDATRRNIMAELHNLFTGNPKFIIIYFAGHGITTDIGSHLVAIDTDVIDPGIDFDLLRKLSAKSNMSETKLLIILDCCHSGNASFRSFTDSPYARNVSNGDIENAVSLGSGKVIIAACEGSGVALENRTIEHGIFTYYLLEALYGDAADNNGNLTVTGLYDYVSKKFEAVSGQTPVFKGDIIGSVIIGSGLKPTKEKDTDNKKKEELIKMAEQLVNNHLGLVSTNIELWKSQKYKESCAHLTPILRWFEQTISRYEDISKNNKFRASFQTAQSKLAEMARLDIGMVLNEGKVVAKIGSGTFGAVWKIETSPNAFAAFKVYHPIDLENNEKLSRFRRGYRAMAQLDHPHIVRVLSSSECPVGFLMNFIDGPNLRDFAADRKTPSEIIPQLLTVAETLKHSHARNVIHRDVKPENIIIKYDVEKNSHVPFLTDFDLAWFSTATQFTQEALGSMNYAAPEQLQNPNSNLSHKPTTDIYAFGQLCFFFICRRDPKLFAFNDNLIALENELKEWRLESSARKIIELYKECSQGKPKDRVQDFREICDRLFEIDQLIDNIDINKAMNFEEFYRELVFSMIGLSHENSISNNSFQTLSKRTHIGISHTSNSASSANFHFRLLSQVPITVEGSTNYKQARMSLNKKIDEVISRYAPIVTRKSGTDGNYEVIINIKNLNLDFTAIEYCRSVLTRVIDVIE